MSKSIGHYVLPTLVCMLGLVSFVMAHEVNIRYRANVGNGPALQPGWYEVEVVTNQNSSEVLFYKEGDLWLRAPVKLAEETKKAQQTEVHYEELEDGKVITKIQLHGSKESLVFNRAPSTKAE